MVYELWELAAGNRIGEYETEADALREVLGAIRLYGAARADTLLLDGVDEAGKTHVIAEGADLAKRALEADRTTA
jgi:hypothetical protein